MNVQVAVLCDAATDNNGKLNILGTFDTIGTRQLPAIHPACAIALRVVFRRTEEGHHKIRINFVNTDGKPALSGIDIPADIQIPKDAISVSRNFIVNIQHLKFETPGDYSIDIAINGRHEVSIPLAVKYIPRPP
ncbi:MAG: hypothetical protein E3K32_12730 [wastewater metagenome]|nr:hypothetical protein [Candidatus Loosdrechtia aerotolerans]